MYLFHLFLLYSTCFFYLHWPPCSTFSSKVRLPPQIHLFLRQKGVLSILFVRFWQLQTPAPMVGSQFLGDMQMSAFLHWYVTNMIFFSVQYFTICTFFLFIFPPTFSRYYQVLLCAGYVPESTFTRIGCQRSSWKWVAFSSYISRLHVFCFLSW